MGLGSQLLYSQPFFSSQSFSSMAASSSSSPPSSSSSCNYRYQVFPSFRGEDVRKTFLSHFLEEFKRKGIETFIDTSIKRGDTIDPELKRAIRDSRIAVVILSKNYASSRSCLDELVQIMKCKRDRGQIVKTIFYGIETSDVAGEEFQKIFEENCAKRTADKKKIWKKALEDAAAIAGEVSLNWDNEAEMIKKIAIDVSNELNFTPSKDFEDMVVIKDHITRISSLLCLESSEVRMVGIWGPAGIGKTTIASALYDQLSSEFQRRCFMENVKESYKGPNLDKYGSKLRLQEEFLSQILDHKEIKIDHLGVLRERLKEQRVLVVLDDVDDIEQLKALANETQWFGSGSRIVVTTQNIQLLKAHKINHIYKVNFPSSAEARRIFCFYAFGQYSPPDGFQDLTTEVLSHSGHLPLGLEVLGSSLLPMSKEEWILALPRFRASLDGEIEEVLRVGYERLNVRDQAIFLYIACLFNGEKVSYVTQLLADCDLDVSYGLQVLANRCLIQTSTGISDRIVMHDLLQQMGREIVRRQYFHEPGKRQFLVDAKDVIDVLANDTGTESILSISLDIADISELFIGEKAFKRMLNLQFLRFHLNRFDEKLRLHLPGGFDQLPHKLRLLRWDAFPGKSLPTRFRAEFLVDLTMQQSKLEKLWEGIQPFPNLKKIDLSWSMNLSGTLELSEARKLEELILNGCENLRRSPNAPSVRYLNVSNTGIQEVPPRIKNFLQLEELSLRNCKKLKKLSLSIFKLERLKSLDVIDCNEDIMVFLAGIIRGAVLGQGSIPDEEVPTYTTELVTRSCLILQVLATPRLTLFQAKHPMYFLNGSTPSALSRFKACVFIGYLGSWLFDCEEDERWKPELENNVGEELKR